MSRPLYRRWDASLGRLDIVHLDVVKHRIDPITGKTLRWLGGGGGGGSLNTVSGLLGGDASVFLEQEIVRGRGDGRWPDEAGTCHDMGFLGTELV